MSDVVVNAALHPLRIDDRVRAYAPAGLTVLEVLGPAAPSFGVWLDGRPLAREDWDVVTLREGQVLDVHLLPSGGKFIGTILSIGVMAAAAAISGGALAGIGLAAGSWGATLAAAGVGLLGRLLTAALVPPPAVGGGGGGEQFRSHPGIGPTSNELRPYNPVPVLFGRRRHYPPQAARPYTELVGNDQFVRMLFTIGIGEYDVVEEKIGDTPLEEFEYEIQYGDGASSLSLFSQDVQEEALGVVMYASAGQGRIEATDLHEATRTTAPDADEISIDLDCIEGMYSISDSTGDTKWAFARVRVEYSLTGADVWSNFLAATGRQRSGDIYYPGEKPKISSSDAVLIAPANTMHIASRKRETVRAGLRWKVARGQYDVRVRYQWYEEDSGTNTDKSKSLSFARIRTIRYQTPINLPGVLVCALRVRATEQLSQGLEKFNVIQTRKLSAWDGGSWTAPQATRSPAWAYVSILTGAPANARPIALSRVMADDMLAWDEQCADLGLTYDDIVDQPTTVLEQARACAAAGLAAWAIVDSRYSVVREVAQTVPAQMFTPRNSSDFQFTKVFTKRPHALQVRFVNEDAEYQQDERVVYADGYIAATATRYEVLQTRGVSKPAHAHIMGRYHLAQLELRPEEYVLNTDMEHVRCTRGDMVRVAHDVTLWGSAWGRVRSLVLTGADVTGAVLDEEVIMEPGASYQLRARHADGSVDLYDVLNDVLGVTTELHLGAAAPELAVGDLVVFGTTGQETVECKITKIEPRDDLTASITMVDATPTILDALTGPVPEWSSSITQPTDPDDIRPPVPRITSMRSDESVLYQDAGGAWKESAVATYAFSVRVGLAHVMIEGRFAPAESPLAWTYVGAVPISSGTLRFTEVEGGTDYIFQLRAVNAGGLSSSWSPDYDHQVVGLSGLPPDVPSLRLEGEWAVWSYPEPPVDFSGFVLATHAGVNPHWASATAAHDGLITESRFLLGPLAYGARTVMVKAYDLAANESADAAVMVLNIGDPLTSNIVVEEDYAAEDFPGSLLGGAVEAGPVLAASGLSLFWAPETTVEPEPPLGSTGEPMLLFPLNITRA